MLISKNWPDVNKGNGVKTIISLTKLQVVAGVATVAILLLSYMYAPAYFFDFNSTGQTYHWYDMLRINTGNVYFLSTFGMSEVRIAVCLLGLTLMMSFRRHAPSRHMIVSLLALALTVFLFRVGFDNPYLLLFVVPLTAVVFLVTAVHNFVIYVTRNRRSAAKPNAHSVDVRTRE
jgi:hypothetical protein